MRQPVPQPALVAVLLALALLVAACASSDAPETSSAQTNHDTDDADGAVTGDTGTGTTPTPASTAGTDELVDDDVPTGYVPPVDLSIEMITVGYLEQWPTPNLLGRADESFDQAFGANVNWVAFGTGAEMTEAMQEGEIDISYSQGVTAFANAFNGGADIRLVGIAVAYTEADTCVAQGSLAVTRDNAADVLDGATVMAPSGDVTSLKMLSMMQLLGVDLDSLKIIETNSSSTVATAFADGDIDVGCAFGGPLTQMLDEFGGDLITTGAEQEANLCFNTYGVVSIPTSYGENHRDAVVAFLGSTQFFNEKWEVDRDGTNPIIAEASRMDSVGNFLSGPIWLSFPSLAEQLSDVWMTGTVAVDMNEQVQALVDLGQIDASIGDFSGAIDTSFLEESIAG